MRGNLWVQRENLPESHAYWAMHRAKFHHQLKAMLLMMRVRIEIYVKLCFPWKLIGIVVVRRASM